MRTIEKLKDAMTLKEIEEAIEEKAVKKELCEIKERSLTATDNRLLPDSLIDDWNFVFDSQCPQFKMQGWRSRTLEGRIDIVREIIYNKIAFKIPVRRCPCGCEYIHGCGTA